MPLIKMLRGLESVMNGIVDCIPRGAAASRTLLIIRRHRIHYPGRGTTKRSSRNSSIFGYHQYFAGHSFPFLLLPSQQRKTKLIIWDRTPTEFVGSTYVSENVFIYRVSQDRRISFQAHRYQRINSERNNKISIVTKY